MKIKTNKEELQAAIATVSNIVSPKATLPILSNMLLETKESLLKLNTTDLDIGISCELPVHVYEQGAITIPAKRLGDIVRELPNGEVVITARKNNQIDIEGLNCRFKLNGLPKEEFPKFPEFKDKDAVLINQKDLKEMIGLTHFAVSYEESRYVLNGLLLEVAGDLVRMVATDGRRLAKMEKKLVHPTSKDFHIIVPIKAVNEINRNLKEEGQVSITYGATQVLFDIDGVLIATRVIEGEFPNYKQVIPKEINTKAKVRTQDLLAAIRRANLLSTPDFQAIKFELFKDKLVISKITPDVGESREEVSVEYGHQELIVGFNPQFFIDVLKNINDEYVPMEFLGPDKPCVLRLKEYLYLALPMRL
ncbi:MAG: DNA polymerase III subunit beta [Candidatus Omnitrophica bacterium]|nr:DNA polymerase III subunit beta [Candidatus Omnitrophota bacterium]MDE2214579.1 DNA polymerase III subunit beta [Candidatus Omnitrophota bacterium]